jgi:hypothetical protein
MTKAKLQWTAIIGILAIALAWLLIFNSSHYIQAKQFIYTSPEISSSLGNVAYAPLYAARIQNDRSYFSFYVIGERKSTSVTFHRACTKLTTLFQAKALIPPLLRSPA